MHAGSSSCVRPQHCSQIDRHATFTRRHLFLGRCRDADSPAGSRSTQELPADEVQAIAREAYFYGYPIVENYKTMYGNAIDVAGTEFKAPFNSLQHEDSVISPADMKVVTPNLDLSLSWLWMDLRSEPLVLTVPEIEAGRYYSIQLIDLYTFGFDYIGSRTTGNAAGRYLIAGPMWKGEVPENVDKVIRCETEFALAKYGTEFRDPEDLENVQRIQQQYAIQPLSSFLGRPAPAPASVTDFPAPGATPPTAITFFQTLNFVLQFCPTHPAEAELMDRMARIGIGAKPTLDIAALSPETQTALKRGAEDAVAAIAAAVPVTHSAEIYGSREFLNNDYMKRAVAAKIRLYRNSRQEALYPLYLTDAEGKPLNSGQTNYVLEIAEGAQPPVNAFWSLTMYDGQSQTLVPNPLNRYVINSEMLSAMVRETDGGLTLYIQHESPVEERTGNWLPAPAGPFYMVMRLYWPRPAAYDGTWTAPLVWRETTAPQPQMPKPAGAEATEEVKPSVLVDEPKPEMERPTIWGEPTEVQVGIYVIDVDEVSSADQSFSASVYYEARWKNPLLRHKGPGPLHRGISEVWTPRLTIIGQQMTWRSFPEAVEIQPDGTVVYRQKMWGRFSQPLQLQDFPCDHQQLSIHIVAAGLLEEHVTMAPLVREARPSSGIAAKFSLPDFDVLSWDASPQPYFAFQDGPGNAGYEMKIEVSRQLSYYVLKVLIPLCLIVIMSWLPRWIAPEQSGTNVGISTTAFLTLVAYMFAITVHLPRVSYITRMDRFILLSTFLVFWGLMQTVMNTVLIRNDKPHVVDKLDRWSRVVYPVLLVLIVAFSFVLF